MERTAILCIYIINFISLQVTSAEIETFFLNNNEYAQYQFKTDEFLYVLSFEEMKERNLDERYGTERAVRRRPVYKTNDKIKR